MIDDRAIVYHVPTLPVLRQSSGKVYTVPDFRTLSRNFAGHGKRPSVDFL
jgi:hypothetical protein